MSGEASVAAVVLPARGVLTTAAAARVQAFSGITPPMV
jgi:hypothetical protein